MQKLVPPNRSELVKLFGKIEFGKWGDEKFHMGFLYLPRDVSRNIINSATKLLTPHIYCNRAMHDALLRAFKNIQNEKILHQLETFDGCFNIRDVRGSPGKLSTHAYGLAIDLNADGNGLGEEPHLTDLFVNCFTRVGFVWGGNFERKDGMHFQWCIED